eukprot:CAMPEP_0179941516 /NCGR_PEP_ID=MMETSP0983-20121128/17026_1 /TAXON_ID=483367 /ORGANISM="non described non described, Strain CCMP 2436" /LENGTH=131 /DNA_ID=CAMNT_0021848559 /DNA_START=223 /DNA_END=614 /DNA_ORIENTATION=+
MRHVRVAAAEYYQPVAEGEERVVRGGDGALPPAETTCVQTCASSAYSYRSLSEPSSSTELPPKMYMLSATRQAVVVAARARVRAGALVPLPLARANAEREHVVENAVVRRATKDDHLRAAVVRDRRVPSPR